MEILDSAILEVILATSNFLIGFSATFINFAKGIGALLLLIVIAKESFKMMVEHEFRPPFLDPATASFFRHIHLAGCSGNATCHLLPFRDESQSAIYVLGR